MADTARLALPLIAAAQSQKHVTHNEALLGLDALVHLACLDRDLSAPPASPAEGARYIVGAPGAGAWTGQAGAVAEWRDGAWHFTPARAGFLAFLADEAIVVVHDGTAWRELGSALASLQGVTRFGLGTTADGTNPFSAKLNAALWTSRGTGEGGSGDLRIVVNKEAPARTATFLFQSGYGGRAEIGLAGSDDLAVKVSPDGTTWRTALTAGASTGGVDFLSASSDVAAGGTVDLGAVATRRVRITGSGTITSFGTGAGRERLLTFAAACTLAHDATNLRLPGGAAIATEAGDTALALSDASGHWTVARYTRASGKALAETFAGYGASFVPAADGVQTLGDAGHRFATAHAVEVRAQAVTVANGGAVSLRDSSGHAVTVPTIQTDDNVVYYSTKSDGSIYPTLAQQANSSAVQPILFYVGVAPGPDGTLGLGRPSSRWSTVYAASGTISTSDARCKTEIARLTEDEVAAAAELAGTVGTFQFLDAVAEKGAGRARHHVGTSVQRAMAILAAHGLDPLRYGFVCHDSWAETPPPPSPPGAAPGAPGPAGDLYAFRADELTLFLLRGLAARIDALETRLPGASTGT